MTCTGNLLSHNFLYDTCQYRKYEYLCIGLPFSRQWDGGTLRQFELDAFSVFAYIVTTSKHACVVLMAGRQFIGLPACSRAQHLGSAWVLLPRATPSFGFSFISIPMYILAFGNPFYSLQALPAHSTASRSPERELQTTQRLAY